ncbi:hypothetical protein [Mucilaginibacter sp.]|uniref:hypothetical protein n=1 Tax=Mucilaginibacter sp. TaxID=1882438 RepID=UPI0025F1DED3|nr:hypothetical protein [Mucilaginibacter sp.]
MSKKIRTIGLIVLAQLAFSIYSCTKTTTVVIDNTPAITTVVSFSKDIQPVLTQSCAISGCHSGAVAPNLSAATGYTVLTGGSLINTSTPEKSEVYLWMTGKKAVTMPLGAANNPSNINAKILAWIKQGAKNN